MGQTAHRFLIFETAGGFCGIAWNDVGITRFQLPTKSPEAAERALLEGKREERYKARRCTLVDVPEILQADAALDRGSQEDRRKPGGSTEAG